jgi:hypothetical protein
VLGVVPTLEDVLGATTLPLAAGVEDDSDPVAAPLGFGAPPWFGEVLGETLWVVTGLSAFLFLFMSPSARAEPLANATIEVRMNAGASLRMGCLHIVG